MSTYQGQCGVCDPDTTACSGSPVLPTLEGQLSGAQRTSLLAEATLYGHIALAPAGKPRVFASGADYLRYKKAQIMVGSAAYTKGRPPPSAIVTGLIAAGCSP